MIISHRYKFIYLKGHKVAGSSVLLALGRMCDADDSVFLPHKGNPPEDVWADSVWGKTRNRIDLPRESTPSQVIEKIGDSLWRNYSKVTVVRNPWDLMVSSFAWAHRNNKEANDSNCKKLFAQWIKKGHPWEGMKKNILRSCLTDDLSNVHHIRFENLQQSYEEVCRHLGVGSVELPRLKSKVRSRISKQPYQYYYSNELRDLVYKKTEEYIEFFGYEFGE